MTETTAAPTRGGVSAFMRLRTAKRKALAEQFDLNLRTEIAESDFEKSKGWLLEAKALGKLDELLLTARETKP